MEGTLSLIKRSVRSSHPTYQVEIGPLDRRLIPIYENRRSVVERPSRIRACRPVIETPLRTPSWTVSRALCISRHVYYSLYAF